MKGIRSTALNAAGLALAFGAGWALKPGREAAPAGPGRAALRGESPRVTAEGAPDADHGGERHAAADSDWERWPEEARRDLEEVRAAMTPGAVNQVLIEKLNAVLNIGEDGIRVPRWQALVSAMRPEDAEAVRDIFRQNDKEGRYWPEEFHALWKQWGTVDGAAAAHSIAYVDKHPMELKNLMSGWGRTDPEAALKWVRENRDAVDVKEAVAGLVEGAGDRRAAGAEALVLANRDDPLIRELYPRIAWMRVYQEGLSGARPWFESLAAGDAPEDFKQTSLQTLVEIMSERTGSESAAALAAQFVSEPWLPADAGAVLGRQWAAAGPAAGVAELERIASPEARKAASSALARHWASSDAEGLSVWLTENGGHPHFDEITLGLVNEISGSDPDAAKAWAGQIRDDSLREAAGGNLERISGGAGPNHPSIKR